MLGLKTIYLEAGSGATSPVPTSLIKAVRENISIPLVVGGGIRNKHEVEEIYNAGADLIILGNACEKNPALLKEACRIRDKFRKV
jgi:putative glycerol-1-phosphate prenyltransferase